MNKNIVYFVLYIVIITELLIVITERDELEAVENEIRDKMLTTLAQMYQQPVVLNVPQRESTYDLNSEQEMRVVLTAAGLVSEEEKDNLNFTVNIDENSRKPRNWPAEGLTLNNPTDEFRIEKDNGNAIFIGKFDREGTYKFNAFCEVQRALPSYLPNHLMDTLRAMIGELKTARSLDQDFLVLAKRTTGVDKKSAEISF
jgi:hypothetical protein